MMDLRRTLCSEACSLFLVPLASYLRRQNCQRDCCPRDQHAAEASPPSVATGALHYLLVVHENLHPLMPGSLRAL